MVGFVEIGRKVKQAGSRDGQQESCRGWGKRGQGYQASIDPVASGPELLSVH
jgi:hypothetical protein